MTTFIRRSMFDAGRSVFFFFAAIACLIAFAGCRTHHHQAATPPAAAVTPPPHDTYVIVHGAWGGGWDWKPVADLLAADSNTVYRPTLTGLGEHYNLASTNIDLDTHIQDIVNVIRWENLHDVVLVGHSYGGMVITGVADRIPGRIKRLVYVDGLVPTNGESADAIFPLKLEQPVRNGYIIPTWVTNNTPLPHDVPQSALTFSQPITLTDQAAAEKIPTTYILTVGDNQPLEQADYYQFYQRAKARGWKTIIMQGDHNVQRTQPKELVKLLEQTP